MTWHCALLSSLPDPAALCRRHVDGEHASVARSRRSLSPEAQQRAGWSACRACERTAPCHASFLDTSSPVPSLQGRSPRWRSSQRGCRVGGGSRASTSRWYRALGYGACGDLRQRLLSPSAWTATLRAHQRSIPAGAARAPPGGSANAGTYGGDETARVARTQHRGRRDAAAWLAMLECHRAKPYAIFVPPAISPGRPARTTDTWPGMEAGTVLTSRARGGLVRPLGMAVQTCRALDPYA